MAKCCLKKERGEYSAIFYICLSQVLTHRVIAEELTSFYDDVGMRCERDAFDTLFDHAPDKLQVNVITITIMFETLDKLQEILTIGGLSYLSSWTLAGGEEEPGDFCEQAPEQDQPGGD